MKVTLIGLGAMGAFFAPRLYEALGEENFKIIAEGKRKERLCGQGVTINGKTWRFPVEEPSFKAAQQGRPSDIIIISVKGYSMPQAIEDIRNQVGENTIILPVLNGVESEEQCAVAYGWEHVLYSYMRISIVMKDGKADFNPNGGLVHFGEKKNQEGQYSERVRKVKEVFDLAKIPYEIDEDMERGIWFKYMCNVGENLTCALLGIPFGAYRNCDSANVIRKGAMREVIAIAQKKGIGLSEEDIERQEGTVMNIPAENKPSTLQDLEAGKHTEIDMFAGNVLRMGEKYGVPTPINWMFYYGIRTLEEK